MRRKGYKSFWRQKQFIIAGAIMVLAAVAMASVYMASREPKEKENNIANEVETERQQVAKADTEEPSKSVTKVIEPKKKEETKTAKATIEGETESDESDKEDEEAVAETMGQAAEVVPELHFGKDSALNWPLQGDVILNYSMDQTVYFATLDQYKYNPAVIIRGAVSERVACAAAGEIADISTNEVTGCTVTVNMGDGYSAIYGQLKEVPYQVGDYVESGSTIGFISEPTKYYSVEGSNLYFELQKDGNPVNPVDFFQ